jgi:hypothetical protein
MFRTRAAPTAGARAYKKTFDAETSRRKRQDSAIQLRKNKREEQLAKRRKNQANQGSGGNAKAAANSLAMLANNSNNSENAGASAANAQLVSQAAQKQLPELIQIIAQGTANLQLQTACVEIIRKKLSVPKDPPIATVIKGGIVPKLVSFLQAPSKKMQFEAAWALTNIASGSSAQCEVVVRANGIQAFIATLGSHDEALREQAVWALGNIAGDCVKFRNMVLQAGAMPRLVALCVKGASMGVLRNCVWAFSNCCRGKNQPDFKYIAPCVPVLAQMIQSKDADILADACWALSYISEDNTSDNRKIDAIVKNNICPRIVALLQHKLANVKTPALRTIGNLVTGNDFQTDAVIRAGALPKLMGLLTAPKKSIVKEACWTISNIAAGNVKQIEGIILSNLVPPLISLATHAEFDVKKEASWALSNITSGGGQKHIEYLVEHGVIVPLCDLLVQSDPKMVLVALEGLGNILRRGEDVAAAPQAQSGGLFGDSTRANKYAELVEEHDGLDHLESLQKHKNENIYQKALTLLKTFFAEEDEDDEDEEIAPQQGTEQFSFGNAGATGAPSFSF